MQETFKNSLLNGESMIRIETPTFVKWAGGKTQLISQYKKLFPHNFSNYFEPFLGSGAVFFYIKQIYNPPKCYISDINEDLINTFKMVKEKTDELIQLLKKYKAENHSKESFYEKREAFNEVTDRLEKASLLIYLNKTCFNGLYRVNSKGEFNVPFGEYKNPAILQEDKLRKASRLLKNVEIEVASFERVLDKAKEKDFIYFDPPYFPLSKTSSFTSYQNDAFMEEEQKRLCEVFKQLDKRGCFVMLSNSDAPFIKGLYKNNGFKIITVKARRAISCVGTGRGKINEIVVKNY
jgi:DNA adenine methylase